MVSSPIQVGSKSCAVGVSGRHVGVLFDEGNQFRFRNRSRTCGVVSSDDGVGVDPFDEVCGTQVGVCDVEEVVTLCGRCRVGECGGSSSSTDAAHNKVVGLFTGDPCEVGAVHPPLRARSWLMVIVPHLEHCW